MKDHTTVSCSWFQDGEWRTQEEVHYYCNISHPGALPDAALCESTIREWEDWHRTRRTRAWLAYEQLPQSYDPMEARANYYKARRAAGGEAG